MASRWRIAVVLSLVLLGAPASFAFGQVTGSIAGTIHDESGAVLPGATVTLRGPSLQRESAVVVAGADGSYRLSLVPPGTYTIATALSGFTTQTRQGVGVAVNQETT